jgi:hypothetical protein
MRRIDDALFLFYERLFLFYVLTRNMWFTCGIFFFVGALCWKWIRFRVKTWPWSVHVFLGLIVVKRDHALRSLRWMGL